MIVLKIIGVILAAIPALILIFLLLRVKIMFSYTPENEPKLYIKLLFFTFGKKKKDPKKDNKTKKPSKILLKIQKRLGIDVFASGEALKQNVDESGISGTAEKVATVISLLAGQIFWLLKRFRLDKLRILAVCGGGDAADAAMDYGLVCAAVYPLAGYLTSNIRTAKNADDVQIVCDFDGDPHFEFDLFVSVRIIHLVRAVLRNANAVAESGIEE